MRTIGISPKVIASVATALSAFAAQCITTGTLDSASAATLAVAVIGGIAAILAPPGTVEAADTSHLEAPPVPAIAEPEPGRVELAEPDAWGTTPDPGDISRNADPDDTAGGWDHPAATP